MSKGPPPPYQESLSLLHAGNLIHALTCCSAWLLKVFIFLSGDLYLANMLSTRVPITSLTVLTCLHTPHAHRTHSRPWSTLLTSEGTWQWESSCSCQAQSAQTPGEQAA